MKIIEKIKISEDLFYNLILIKYFMLTKYFDLWYNGIELLRFYLVELEYAYNLVHRGVRLFLSGHQIATTSGAAGAKRWFNDNNKQYTGVTMTKVSSDTMAEVQLWKNWILGDVHCPEDQVFRNSSGNRAWWYGDGEANYHIYSKVIGNNGQTVTLKGTFEDYQ